MPSILLSRTMEDIVARVLAKLEDPDMDAYDRGRLLPFVKIACEEFNLYMRDKRIDQLRYRSELDVPANTSVLTRGSEAYSLPQYLIVPVQLWERPDGSTDEGAWTPLFGPKLLPNVSSGASMLTRWNWMQDKIQLLPATQIRELRIDYMGETVPLALPTDQLHVPDSILPIVEMVCREVAASRADNAGAQLYDAKARDYMFTIANEQIKAKQCVGLRRPRPYPRWSY